MTVRNPIKIDLRTDIAKVRERINVSAMGKCRYGSPCAVGAMIDGYSRRRRLDLSTDEFGNIQAVDHLVRDGYVELPSNQLADAVKLQAAFDAGDQQEFWGKLAELERKYA